MWYEAQIPWALCKLLLAAAVGGAIGFERESHGQAAGLRTNILVCVGACLLMMLSLYMEEVFRMHQANESVVRLDPGRIASYAIASMGFLGAGAIITGKGTVRGLTTAAGLWLVTGMGLAIGANFIIPALMATVVCLVILFGFRRVKKLFTRDVFNILIVKYHKYHNPLADLHDLLEQYKMQIQTMSYHLERPDEIVTYRLGLQGRDNLPFHEITDRLVAFPELREIEWREGEVP